MCDLRSYSRSWVKEFIEIYKNEECLWNASHMEYNNNVLRNKAYEKLVQKLKEVEQNADRIMAIRKIGSLRSAFRREQRKKKQWNSYKPRLWYFNILSFIANNNCTTKDQIKSTCSTIQSVNEHIVEQDVSKYDQSFTTNNNVNQTIAVHSINEAKPTSNEILIETSNQQQQQSTVLSSGINDIILSKEPVKMISSYYNPNYIPILNTQILKQEDEYDGIGRNVAGKLRHMKNTQRVIAEKLISDVLYNGQLDNLTTAAEIT